MADNVFEKVKKVVCEELGVQESEVKPESSFTEDLGADSLDVVELVMALEEQFSTDIPDDDVANLKTVGDVVSYIEKKLG
ncbi:MAG: acyl carrier protein [Armatimonadetes bacterium]|nr:acyl carrier protein [Armatimonadota bacterium]